MTLDDNDDQSWGKEVNLCTCSETASDRRDGSLIHAHEVHTVFVDEGKGEKLEEFKNLQEICLERKFFGIFEIVETENESCFSGK